MFRTFLLSGTRDTNAGMAASKAGAYGGSELGSILGGAVGPPIIGSVIGNIVGEKVGEKVIVDTGRLSIAKTFIPYRYTVRQQF